MLDWLFAWWWIGVVEALVMAGIVGLIALNAHRIVGDAPTSLASLRASMGLTALAMVSAYIIVMLLVIKLLGVSGGSSLVVAATVIAFLVTLFQWLFGPYMINIMYRTRPPQTREEAWLELEVKRLAEASGIKPPKLVIADMDMPNAFAYGSPIAGSYVAVTRGLLRLMNKDEVRAVLGHEVGHLKHRDVSWILALSLVPLIVYFLGRMLLWTGLLSGGERRQGNPAVFLALGVALIAAGVFFKFLVSHFNRLREYYADAHGALVTGNPRALQRALAKLQLAYESDLRAIEDARSHSFVSMLFIVAPLVEVNGGFFYDIDYAVERLKRRRVNPIEEIFSTHPPIPKRLRFLDRIAARML